MTEEAKNVLRGLALLLVSVSIAAWVGWLFAKDLLFDVGVAAWVQAIGSILAIVAATAIAARQGREAEARDVQARAFAAQQEQRARVERLQGAIGVASVAIRRIQFLRELARDATRQQLLLSGDTWAKLLDYVEVALGSFPLASVGDARVINALHDIQTQVFFTRSALKNLVETNPRTAETWTSTITALDQSAQYSQTAIETIQAAVDEAMR